jgi:heme/copper-type cytochrome/quinol oxidase subunit 2
MSLIGLKPLLMLGCLLLFLASFITLLVVTWRRHRSGKQGDGNFHETLRVEMAWVLVPALIVLVLLWLIARAFWGN